MERRTPSSGDDRPLSRSRGLLCDLDGTLYVGNSLIPGADEAVAYLRAAGLKLRFLTNTTTRSRRSLHAHLKSLGLAVEQDEILSAAYAGVLYLRSIGSPRCRLVLAEDPAADYEEFRKDDADPEAIVVGDIGERWSYDLLNSLFHQVAGGARLVALHKNRYYETPNGLSLDIGAFVAAVEYAAGIEAATIGKPAAAFFDLALDELGLPAEEVIIIGDDIDNDVGAGQANGLTGILVRTGKFRGNFAAVSHVKPMFTVDSVSSLPQLLEKFRNRT